MPEGDGESPSIGQLRRDKLSEIEDTMRAMQGFADNDSLYATLLSQLQTFITELTEIE